MAFIRPQLALKTATLHPEDTGGDSSFDRMMGYGLKYADAFQHTHLGMIGRVPATSAD